MNARFPYLCGLIFLTSLLLAACGGPKIMSNPMPESGFLPNYGLLKPVSGISQSKSSSLNVSRAAEDIRYWRYVKGDVNKDTYKAVIIEPIFINQQQTQSISAESIANTKAVLQESMRQAILQHGGIKIVTKPGPNVFRIAVGITGAEEHANTLQPWFFTPVGLAVNAAALAADLNAKTPALVIEAKTTDSQSNLLLGEGLMIIQGETFRTESGSLEEFTNLAKRAVKTVMEISANSSPIGN